METQTIKKNISLPRGGVLEVELTPKFLEVVSTHFALPDPGYVDDDHIRMYIWGAFKNAIDKSEK